MKLRASKGGSALLAAFGLLLVFLLALAAGLYFRLGPELIRRPKLDPAFQLVPAIDLASLRSHDHRRARRFECFGNAPEVPHPVIEDRYFQRMPFVEGMSSPARGSRSTASDSARPRALNMASVEWWALRP